MSVKTDRNVKVDIIRGCATIMVVIYHVVEKFQDSSDSILHNILFSIQMPLFMMVSGYVRNYGGGGKQCKGVLSSY